MAVGMVTHRRWLAITGMVTIFLFMPLNLWLGRKDQSKRRRPSI
jgi:hypothetical protein